MLLNPQPFRSPSIPTIHPQCAYRRTMWRLRAGPNSPRLCHFAASRKLWNIPVGIPNNYFQDRCLILSALPAISTEPRPVLLVYISNCRRKRQLQHSSPLPMPTKLVFTRNLSLETTIAFEATGHPFYEVETENSAVQKTAIVRELDLSMSDLCFFVQSG